MADTIRYAGRDNLVISTKFGYDFYSDVGTEGSHKERKQDFSPKFIRYALEQSLQRMKIDCIDLYQAHNLKLPQFNDDMFAVLGRLKEEGKIKAWGVALGPAIGWREEGIAALSERGATTVQTVFNLFEQAPGREFCEMAEPLDRSILARVPMNSGILEDIFNENTTFGPNDHRKYRDRDWLIYGLKKVEKIRPIAEAHGWSISQLAIKWLLRWDSLASIEPNILNQDQLKEWTAICDDPAQLSDAEFEQLHRDYRADFGLGEPAHPCLLKSSVASEGTVRSEYVAPGLQERLASGG